MTARYGDAFWYVGGYIWKIYLDRQSGLNSMATFRFVDTLVQVPKNCGHFSWKLATFGDTCLNMLKPRCPLMIEVHRDRGLMSSPYTFTNHPRPSARASL